METRLQLKTHPHKADWRHAALKIRLWLETQHFVPGETMLRIWIFEIREPKKTTLVGFEKRFVVDIVIDVRKRIAFQSMQPQTINILDYHASCSRLLPKTKADRRNDFFFTVIANPDFFKGRSDLGFYSSSERSESRSTCMFVLNYARTVISM